MPAPINNTPPPIASTTADVLAAAADIPMTLNVIRPARPAVKLSDVARPINQSVTINPESQRECFVSIGVPFPNHGVAIGVPEL